MALISDFADVDLHRQIASLSKELAALKKVAAKRGGAYYEDGRDAAMDFYSDLADRISDSLPALRKRARVVRSTAQDHPAAAVAVGIAVVGLLAGLAFSRR